jgi:hypothetical protein
MHLHFIKHFLNPKLLQTEVADLNYSFPRFIHYTNFCALIPFLENRLSHFGVFRGDNELK